MGLGTGRRGMKSPPLLIAVLLACVFVLGINYWITSSRCVELQNRVMDLEGRMRRAAAERGAVEMKKNEYEDMLAKQRKQIDNIQTLHSSQMQNIHLVCSSEKEHLLKNMTVQITSLQKRLEDCKLELNGLQESQTKKLSYELAQCTNKVKEAKEQCEERLRKAGLKESEPVNQYVDKSLIKPTIKQEVNQQDTNIEEVKSKGSVMPALSLLVKDKKDDVAPPPEEKAKPLIVLEKKPSPAPKEKVEEKVDEKVEEKVDDDQGPVNEVNPNLGNAEEDDEPKVEDVIDKDANKENEEVDRENLLNLEGQQEDEKEEKPDEQEEEAENGNDYNGEDTNVAEPEAEKQAQLIDNEQNLKDEKKQSGLNGRGLDPEAEDSEDPPVK